MSRRHRRERAKWNRRLLPQIGMIVSTIFVLTIAVSAYIQVRGTTSTYLEAKEEIMRPMAKRMQESIAKYGNIGSIFRTWLDLPEDYEIWMDYDESDPNYKELTGYYEINEDGIPIYEPEEFESFENRKKNLLAAYAYNTVFTELLLCLYQQETVTSMLVDMTDENWGKVLMLTEDLYTVMEDDKRDEINPHRGEDYSEVLQYVTSLKKVMKGESVYERFDSPKDGEYYYLYMEPVMEDGEVKAALILSYNWSDFHSNLIRKQILVAGIAGLVLLGAAVLLLFFINRSAIRPLGKIQQGVRLYMQNKNSEEVAERMDQIKQKNEFGVLADDVTQLAVEIDRYTDEITHLTGEKERVAAELSLAAEIQLGVLPVEFPDVPDYKLYATMTPAKEVGGDLYDFFDIDETHLGLVIGDVSGKGVPASLFMMIAKLLIREYAMAGGDPAEVLAKANKTLCENNTNDMFVTAWFGILDRTTGKIVAASAGHEYPILRDPDGEYRLIKDKRGFVLGGMDISKYKEYELELKPGGTILVYTDGAPEATNAQEELFGTDRMLEVLNQHTEDAPKELVEHLKGAIETFVGEAPQFDDLTMLCVRLEKKAD